MNYMGKKKMSNFKFRLLVIPWLLLSLLLSLAVPAVQKMVPDLLDDYLGSGTQKLNNDKVIGDKKADYYTISGSGDEIKAKSYEIAEQVQAEGTVLLKNDGVLPLKAGSEVTPFGYGYLNPVYGQLTSSGSAKWTMDPVTPKEGLKDVYKVNNVTEKLMKEAGDPTPVKEKKGTLSAGSLNTLMGGSSMLYEYNPNIYNGIAIELKQSTAVVFITRSGQEGSDKKNDAYEDGTPHYLALSKNERNTIKKAKELCGSVVVVLASSAPIEVGDLMTGALEVNAIMQVGHVGEKGFAMLGKLMSGEINPSGKTVDIWPTDFTKDPTYQNFGEFTYTNATFTSHSIGSPSSKTENGDFARYFIDYDEGIYVGYRYYETAAVEDSEFKYGQLDGKGAFTEKGAVAYPFGYGLSYTTFEKEITGHKEDENGVLLTVRVRNIGDRAGKDVIEVYQTSPYTDFDKSNKIEKPAVVLAAYEKTALLKPGDVEEKQIYVSKDDLTSYSYTHENADGSKGCYVLEEGDYVLSLRDDSHRVVSSVTFNEAATKWYEPGNPRKSETDAQNASEADKVVAATNLFQDSSDYMNEESTVLSRADWKGTFPKRPENREKTLSSKFVQKLGIEESFDPKTDKQFGNVENSIVYQKEDPNYKEGNLLLSEMRGLDYNDSKWEEFLDQIDYKNGKQLDEVLKLMEVSNYATNQVRALGIGETKEADGANGIKTLKTDEGMKLTATYGYAPLMASTWNKELMYDVGHIFGQEAVQTGIQGWYSPAINLHRSPFAGRIYEYYSEDPLLTGKMAAAVISGAGDSGLVCYLKHFALNEQDTNREFTLHTWATEQAMRELYLKAFEIPVKEAVMTISYYDEDGKMQKKTMRAATAIMASQNDIGGVIAHANYPLLTSLLRDEWGFKGVVHSDMFVWNGEKTMYDLSFRSGLDTFLTLSMFAGMTDTKSPTSHYVMRRAVHDVAYTFANSSAMQGIAPKAYSYTTVAPWKIIFGGVRTLSAFVLIGGIYLIIRRTKSEKQHPEMYISKKRRSK